MLRSVCSIYWCLICDFLYLNFTIDALPTKVSYELPPLLHFNLYLIFTIPDQMAQCQAVPNYPFWAIPCSLCRYDLSEADITPVTIPYVSFTLKPFVSPPNPPLFQVQLISFSL